MPKPTAVDRFLETVCTATTESCDAWAPDASLDATVPNWRFRRSGAEAIRETNRTWLADPGRIEHLRREPISTGEVVEYDLAWTEDGVPHAAHHLHLLDVADDRIVADVVLCGGRWPASLLAADMVAADA